MARSQDFQRSLSPDSGLSRATCVGLADMVRLWAQALHASPQSQAPPAAWLHALHGAATAPVITLNVPAEQPTEPPPPNPPEIPNEAPESDETSPVTSVNQPARLQAPVLHIREADFQPASEQAATVRQLAALPPLDPSDYEPLPNSSSEPWQPLAPRSRWWPALRRFTPQVWAGPDLPRLVGQLARGHVPRRLPRLVRSGRFHRLLILRDRRRGMLPYARDFETLLAQLRAQPQAREQQVISLYGRPPLVPADVDGVLILSDLGLCDAPSAEVVEQTWIAWARSLARRRVAVQAWLPLSMQMVPGALVRVMGCVPWHEHSRFRVCRAGPDGADARVPTPETLMPQLWPWLAVAQRIEPALLRRARLLAGGRAQPQWEGVLWQASSEHAAGEQVLQLLPHRVEAWRRAFAEMPPQAQLQVWQALTAQHAHLPRSTLFVERLIWCAHAAPEAIAAVADELAQAKDWLSRLDAQEARHSETQAQVTGSGQPRALHAEFLQGLVLRNSADPVFIRANKMSYARLAVAAGLMGEGQGIATAVWAQAMPARTGHDHPPWAVLLHRTSPEPVLEKRGGPPQPVDWQGPVRGRHALLPVAGRQDAIWQPEGGPPQTLKAVQPAEPGDVCFRDDQGLHHLRLGYLHRQHWQAALGCDHYGVFCEVQVKTIRLRLRYLPPATFLQGSPEGVGDRDEHPQHPVTLTQGLWLAETPCTQALWQAVMGKNPSHFDEGRDAPMRPVENVSWDDAQDFLHNLTPMLPAGCEAVLPTESQWEYACRAGTQTAYWWGDEFDAGKANVNLTQKRSFADKEGTSPVNHYPPNPWGLYDMHGNVWEWCAGGKRTYTAEPARDPEDSMDESLCAVRGGSWIGLPDFARAACRFGWLHGDADLGRGFRFALRSCSRPEAGSGGHSEAGRVGAAGGRTAGADAPAAQPAPTVKGQTVKGKFRSGKHSRDP